MFLTLRAADGVAAPLPGQFMHLRPAGGAGAPLLRRPMSIAFARAADEGSGAVWSSLFGVIGPGTQALAALRAGDPIDVLGPLGRPYTLPLQGECAVLIGGGRGIAPLVFLADACARAGCETVFLAGARRKDLLWIPENCAVGVHCATDDGSLGAHGTVMDLLHALPHDVIRHATFYACGPHKLLARVAEFARAHGRPAQVSMEARMGCAMNVCRGCVVPVLDDGRRYATVCTDGPVFDGADLDWPALAHIEDAGYGVAHGPRTHV